MDRLIKVIIAFLLIAVTGLIAGAGYMAYRIFFQSNTEVRASPSQAKKTELSLNWNQVKSDAEKMTAAFLNVIKSESSSAQPPPELDGIWQSLARLEQEGRKILKIIEGDYAKRVTEGARTQAQVNEAMSELAKQYDLAMVYAYGHVWPKVLNNLAQKQFNLYDVENVKKLGPDWKDPMPLEPFAKTAQNLRVWPPQNNLLSQQFGESTTPNIFSR
ncbi:MAG: hypothetical protein AAB091_07760 [Elusimicrobiota bacterium]